METVYYLLILFYPGFFSSTLVYPMSNIIIYVLCFLSPYYLIIFSTQLIWLMKQSVKHGNQHIFNVHKPCHALGWRAAEDRLPACLRHYLGPTDTLHGELGAWGRGLSPALTQRFTMVQSERSSCVSEQKRPVLC